MKETESNPIAKFRNRLLLKTFDWCVSNSPFYADRFAPVSNFSGLQDLQRLPVLTRDEAVANRKTLTCGRGAPAYLQYTTGTTGTFFPLYRSAAEAEFISSFYEQRLREMLAPGRTLPLCMALTSNYHGSSTPMPSSAYVISAGVYDRTQAQQAARLLQHRFDFEGIEETISVIAGADILVKALTAHLIDQGVDPATLGVRRLVLTGGYLSTSQKNHVARLWNATIQDRYSMSEIFGGAVQNAPGGPLIFDVEIIPEVIHPRTHAPIREGIGALVLTSLYPFSQMSPMIRYYTGDLVEILSEESAQTGNLVAHLRGRERRSAIDVMGPEVVPLLLSTDLHDAIDTVPDIARSLRFADLASKESMEFAGKAHYDIQVEQKDGRPDRIVITLGLRYAPWMFPDRVEEMITALRSHLYARSPVLAQRVGAGDLSLQIVTMTGDAVRPYSMK